MKTEKLYYPSDLARAGRSGVYALVSLALIATLTLGCNSKIVDPVQLRADETALVRNTVTDPARAERLIELFDERDRLQIESAKLVQQYRQSMQALNAEYDAADEQILALMGNYDRAREQYQLKFLDQLAAMKQATTAGEWEVIARFQLENFQPRKLVYQDWREAL